MIQTDLVLHFHFCFAVYQDKLPFKIVMVVSAAMLSGLKTTALSRRQQADEKMWSFSVTRMDRIRRFFLEIEPERDSECICLLSLHLYVSTHSHPHPHPSPRTTEEPAKHRKCFSVCVERLKEAGSRESKEEIYGCSERGREEKKREEDGLDGGYDRLRPLKPTPLQRGAAERTSRTLVTCCTRRIEFIW